MITRFWFGTRRAGLSLEAFSTHWREIHVGFGLALPGLRGYVQNHPVAGAPPLPAAFDGCSELDFDSVEAMQHAFAAPEIVQADADERAFADPDRFAVLVSRRHVLFGGEVADPPARVLCALRSNPRAPAHEPAERFLDGGGAARAARMGAVRAEVYLPVAEAPEPQACDLLLSVWFEDLPSATGALTAWAGEIEQVLRGSVFGRELAVLAPVRHR